MPIDQPNHDFVFSHALSTDTMTTDDTSTRNVSTEESVYSDDGQDKASTLILDVSTLKLQDLLK